MERLKFKDSTIALAAHISVGETGGSFPNSNQRGNLRLFSFVESLAFLIDLESLRAPKFSIMSVSKPLLVLLPAVLAVPLALPATVAQAQQKTAAQPQQTPAALTAPTKPASAIAPRQSLPTFTAVKATVSPLLALPAAGKPITPPVPVAVPVAAPVKEAALPAPQHKPVVASWSARQNSTLATPAPLSATPRINSRRRAFAAEVSLSTSPLNQTKAPAKIAAPVAIVAPLAPVKAIGPLPRNTVKAETAPIARPSALASREARARELALARMDAQLAGAEARLGRAQSKLTAGQRQLGSVNQLLQSAMLSSGGNGLHPFVRVAQRYLGTPYVWGGESARGFDCSGFIMRVMRDLGYRALPHSAAEQFNYGKPISKGLLQAGDIVFFANTYKPGISHVGIYLGGGRFIHAANSQVGTIVSNLNSAKWVAHYAGARRLMKVS